MGRKIIITGPYTDADVEALLVLIRKIEQRDPDGLFTISAEDIGPHRTLAEAKEFLLSSFPAVDGVPVEVETYTK